MGSGLPSVSLPAPHSDGAGRGGVDAHASWSMAGVALASAGGVDEWMAESSHVGISETTSSPASAPADLWGGLVKGAQVVFLHGADGELRG